MHCAETGWMPLHRGTWGDKNAVKPDQASCFIPAGLGIELYTSLNTLTYHLHSTHCKPCWAFLSKASHFRKDDGAVHTMIKCVMSIQIKNKTRCSQRPKQNIPHEMAQLISLPKHKTPSSQTIVTIYRERMKLYILHLVIWTMLHITKNMFKLALHLEFKSSVFSDFVFKSILIFLDTLILYILFFIIHTNNSSFKHRDVSFRTSVIPTSNKMQTSWSNVSVTCASFDIREFVTILVFWDSLILTSWTMQTSRRNILVTRACFNFPKSVAVVF